MTNQEKLQKINKELKVYINESSFISMKCRNQVLKLFGDAFALDLDIGPFQNVDLSIQEDYKVLYREDFYESKAKITSMEEVEKRYQMFQEKADALLKRKDIDFQGRRNLSNLLNLLFILGISLLAIVIVLVMIRAFLIGSYLDLLWFVVIIVPAVVPRFKNSLQNRFQQAKNYLKSLKKKVK